MQDGYYFSNKGVTNNSSLSYNRMTIKCENKSIIALTIKSTTSEYKNKNMGMARDEHGSI